MELHAPPHWQSVDLISDLHLQAELPATVDAWTRYLQTTAAQAVFMLGDIFEVWVGDDAAEQPGSFEAQCLASLRKASERTEIFLLHGNRDFLVGHAFTSACNATLLPDPTVLVFGSERTVLTHGDALCLDDTEYQRFRTMVRSETWQRDFLGKPLLERQRIARELRLQSAAVQTQKQGVYDDVDPSATLELMHTLNGTRLIHGHTHRPADHQLENGITRCVLTDWDLDATPHRAEALRLRLTDTSGLKVERLSLVD